MRRRELIEKLAREATLDPDEFRTLLASQEADAPGRTAPAWDADDEDLLYARARTVREERYGTDVYLRGLIEFTNHCRNDCFYCGVRRSNRDVSRYRLDPSQILDCCDAGYHLGFRTFVLQGGEDPYFTDDRICSLVDTIREHYPDCAITLSIGEKERASYQAYFDAGADRYLLREETADPEHYAYLHPCELSLENRMRCLCDLKDIGFQVGCGFMVGSPGQTVDDVMADLRFMQDLRPHMVGIGPFIPHHDTPFRDEPAGSLDDTLHLLAIIRLMFPDVLLPATTALGTIDPHGRQKGLRAGANVIMPNLSPRDVRSKYLLYDGKPSTGEDAAENHAALIRVIEDAGYHAVVSRGDAASIRHAGRLHR